MKKAKDFTDEEKATIIKKLKKARPANVAKKFNTTWQTVLAISRAAGERDSVPTKTNVKTSVPLKFENEILKDKIKTLTEQIEKLRAVIKELA